MLQAHRSKSINSVTLLGSSKKFHTRGSLTFLVSVDKSLPNKYILFKRKRKPRNGETKVKDKCSFMQRPPDICP